MKTVAIRHIAWILWLSLTALSASGQRIMPVVINSDTTIAAGDYVAQHNVLIAKNATLSFAPGTRLLLNEGVVIKIEGGLHMQGSEMGFAEISSANSEKPGKGLLIADVSTAKVQLNRVRFHHLEVPLEFEQYWHRPLVEITQSEFKENKSYTPGVFIRVPESIETSSLCQFNFIGNSYIDNVGGIYFENVDQQNFKIRFEHNFVYGNRSYGAGPEGMLTAPFFFRCDHTGDLANFSMVNNVFDQNFIHDSEFDTVVAEVNMGVAGDASKVLVDGNYYGGHNLPDKTKNLDHFSNNNQSPFLQINPDLKNVPEGMPPFVTAVYLNGENISVDPNYLFEPTPELELKLTFKDEVDVANSNPQVQYTAFNDETHEELSGTLETNVQWVDKKTALFKSTDAVLSKVSRIFFSFTGIVSKALFSVPNYRLGENGYHIFQAKNNAGGLENLQKFSGKGDGPGGDDGNSPIDPKMLEDIIARQDSLEKLLEKMKLAENTTYEDIIAEAEKQIIFAKYFKGSYEFGVFLGSSAYFGDMTGNAFIFDPKDPAPAFGLVFKYNFTERFTLSSSLIQGTLKGNEADNLRGTSYPDRGFNFHSPLTEISFNAEYNLNKLGFGNQGRFTPAISIGIAGFRFNPKYNYQFAPNFVKEVNLHELYTAGLDPNAPNYSLTSLAIPFGFHIKTVVKQRFLMDFNFSWRYTFTDFIDDMGKPGVYRDKSYFTNKLGNSTYPFYPGTTKADVAFDIHNSMNPDSYWKVGQNRYGANNDWYFIMGVSFTYIRPHYKKVKAN